jgi:RNA polymerase sigma factor (sigma-70 family)
MTRMDGVATSVATDPGAPPGGTPGPDLGFEDFFQEHRLRLFRALWLVTRNRHEAEEVMQDAFLRVWERWPRVAVMPDPVGYLYRTAMNLWRSRVRRAAVALRKAIRQVPADDQLEAVEERDAAIRAMASLTPRQRAAVVLTDVLGLTSVEAAEALRIEPVTVRVLAARAREVLRNEMGDRDG